MTEIQRLESELIKKNQELAQLWKAYNALFEKFKSSTQSLKQIKSQLKDAESHLQFLKAYINEYIVDLAEENKKLKFSADMWLKRALKLESDVLIARDEMQKMEAEQSLAITRMLILEADLNSVKKCMIRKNITDGSV
jgi:chromosome segregation ATPase